MKKILVASVLILLVCSAAFAEGYNKWTFAANPYSFQHYSNGTDSVKSKYGVGGTIGYGYVFDFEEYGIIVGADVLADTYFIEDKTNFTDVGILAKVGYIFGSVEKKVDFYGLFKYGVDLQCYEDKYSAVQTFGHQIGLECFVSDRWSLTGAVEVLFATPKKNDVQYFNIRCNPYIGMCYSY